MAKTTKKSENMNEVANTRMQDYREHLKTITNGLIEVAKTAGRTDFKCNQLLRECYNLVDVELNTFDGWKAKGAQVKKGQHAYLFWGAPVEKDNYKFCPVRFLFAREQVRFEQAVAEA
ncbi:MAG: hypothetical protein MJZ82_01910 [Paludibacteraceae bacterium]|nr:hypothetical protein [Paludibacteraceae bacterium]